MEDKESLPPASSSALGGDNSVDDRTAEEIQSQRDRQAAEYELSLSRVQPISTDFHWFSQEQLSKETLPSAEIENDLYLRNSYLNGRLKHVWESLEPEDRLEHLKKEEADRRRFTEEEEVASRHCATLTARAPTTSSSSSSNSLKRSAFSSNTAKSPTNGGGGGGGGDSGEIDDDIDEEEDDEGESLVAPAKKIKNGKHHADATTAATESSSFSEVAPSGT